LEYGSVIFDNCSTPDNNLLERTQMRAAKVVLGCLRTTSHAKIRAQLALPNLDTRRKITLLTYFFKILNGSAPSYLSKNCPKFLKDALLFSSPSLKCKNFLCTNISSKNVIFYHASNLWDFFQLKYKNQNQEVLLPLD